MKIIIYVDQSKRDGIEVRFRTQIAPAFHLQESRGFETVEAAVNYAEAFSRGAVVAGAKTIVALDSSVADMNDTLNGGYPVYGQAMKKESFKDAWESLCQ